MTPASFRFLFLLLVYIIASEASLFLPPVREQALVGTNYRSAREDELETGLHLTPSHGHQRAAENTMLARAILSSLCLRLSSSLNFPSFHPFVNFWLLWEQVSVQDSLAGFRTSKTILFLPFKCESSENALSFRK